MLKLKNFTNKILKMIMMKNKNKLKKNTKIKLKILEKKMHLNKKIIQMLQKNNIKNKLKT